MAPKPRIPAELKRGPFSLHEARTAGLTRRALAGKAWRRLGRGFYCWRECDDDPWRLLVAWRNNLPPQAVFAGFSAAWLYRLDVDPSHPVEVVVPPWSGVRSRAGLHVRHCRLLRSDATTVRGLRVTTVERTFRDLARRLDALEYLVLADAALRLGLGRFSDNAEPAESPMETPLRWLLLQSGLPHPQVQAELRNPEGRFIARADLFYPSARLVIEFDGGSHRERLVDDNRRQNELLSAGFKLLRFTASDVYQRPEAVGVVVRNALSAPA